MIFRLSLIAFFLVITQPAMALITIISFGPESYSRAEGRIFGDITLSTNIIYGGLSGTCDNPVSNSVCNSCASNLSTGACNTRRIHDNLNFIVTFTSDTAGQILVTDDINPGQTPPQANLTFSGFASGVVVPANTTISIQIPWSEICTKVFKAASCDESAVFTAPTRRRIRIGIDAGVSTGNPPAINPIGNGTLEEGEFSNEVEISMAKLSGATTDLCISGSSDPAVGACNFTAYPGDSKVFVENVRTDCSFPNVPDSSAQIQALKVYYQLATEGSPDKTSPSTDLLVGNTSQSCVNGVKAISLEKNEVTGLQNNTQYRFAVGVVDQANNVGLITQHNDALAIDDNSECYNDEWQNNCHFAEPQEVFGLIQDEFDCFITTAAYGTPFKPKVQTFREFRNRYLKTNSLGRSIISFYYSNSPPMASWIRSHPHRQAITRFVLWPFWLFAHLSLHYPMILLAAIMALVSGFILTKKGRAE